MGIGFGAIEKPSELVTRNKKAMPMIQKIKVYIVAVCAALFLSWGNAWAFAVSDLAAYNSFAVKTMTMTDTLRPEKKHTLEITGTKDLEYVLGKEKATFTAKYVYMGKDNIEENSTAKWYYYYQPSWNGRGRGKLHYTRNAVMQAGKAGDMLVVAKKTSTEILLLIVKQDSAAYTQVKDALGLKGGANKKTAAKEHNAWWAKLLWKTETQTAQDYDIADAALAVPDIPTKGWVRIYFTPGPDCENNIIAQIEKSKKNIDVAVYSITNQRIVNSLIAAQKRGIKIRVLSDRRQSKGKGSLIAQVKDAGIPVVLNRKHKTMHNKFAIFDTKDIETGSYNWTESATKYNAENCLFFPEPDGEYNKQFKYLWNLYQG